MQVETDTNMAHVPEGLRKMTGFIEAVSRSDPPWPIVFREHPASDGGRGLQALREQDIVLGPKDGTMYGLLQHPGCLGVVTLNSNTAHDALAWGIPSVTLGRHVWPKDSGPMVHELPADWRAFAALAHDESWRNDRLRYATQLADIQWTLEQASDMERVSNAVLDAIVYWEGHHWEPPAVNVVAKGNGWLFGDLKRRYEERDGVIASNEPLVDAKAYMFLRPHEAAASPDQGRTIVQYHSMAALDDAGMKGWTDAAAHILVHPEQRMRAQLPESDTPCFCEPMGADSSFIVRSEMSDKFRVGWVGRALAGKRIDMFARVCGKAAQHIPGFQAVLLGERLGGGASALGRAGVDVEVISKGEIGYRGYPAVYASLDALVITSESETGPLVLFEALKCGVPVISTPVGWCPRLIANGANGWIETDESAMALNLRELAENRAAWWAKSAAIAETAADMDLDKWLDATVEFAKTVCHGKQRLIVVGCGRSGTTYFARALQSAGLDFGHETLGADGGIGWNLIMPKWRCQWRETDVILHQVREPWAAIASLTTHTDGVWVPVSGMIGGLPEDPVRRAAEYWLRWNRLCAEAAAVTYQVESVEDETCPVWDALGKRPGDCAFPPADTNHRRHDNIDTACLPKSLVKAVTSLGAEYGYQSS